MTSQPRIAFAGNRAIAVSALRMLIDAGLIPVCLLVSDDKDVAAQLKALAPGIPVLEGKNALKAEEGLRILADAEPDYLLSIHYPYIIPKPAIALAKIGTLNLHPAFLPWNRGWHTPSWAIAEGTPYGATFHWVDEGVDTGDIIAQKQIPVHSWDTAHTLYQRALGAELEVFRGALPLLMNNALPRHPQRGEGTAHKKADLASIQKLDLQESKPVGEVLKTLRALTTNDPKEAAYFEENGKKYRVRVEITEE